jgi:DNA-binding beta-propeller fold protein YncE
MPSGRACLAGALALTGLVTSACGTEVERGSTPVWPDPTGVPAVGNGKILITNSGDDSVSWIDLDTLEVVYRQPVGLVPPEREGPHHGAAPADGSAIFVGLSNVIPGAGSGPHGTHGQGTVPGYLVKLDPGTLELLGVARVDRSPGDVRLTPDGGKALLSHFDLRKIQEVAEHGGPVEDMIAPLAIVDTATMRVEELVPTCPAGHGITPTADGQRAYVACWGSDELAIVDLASPYLVERHHIGDLPIDPTSPVFGPYAVAESPSDGLVWVSTIIGKELRFFDPGAAAWLDGDTLTMNGAPYFGAFTADGSRFYVAVQNQDALVTIDGTTRQVVDTLAFAQSECLAPHAVLLLESKQVLLVVCEGDHVGPGQVAIVDLSDPAPTYQRSLTVGVFPDDAFVLGPRAP